MLKLLLIKVVLMKESMRPFPLNIQTFFRAVIKNHYHLAPKDRNWCWQTDTCTPSVDDQTLILDKRYTELSLMLDCL